MSTVHVLGNPAAGGGSGDTESVADDLRAMGHDLVVLDAGSAAASAEMASAAVRSGAERLVVVGGDGLVRIAVGAVAESSTVLGIVPQGTGNDFARALGLLDGSRTEQTARAAADAVAVDAMWTTHGWVASVATVGFSGDVTARANALRWPRGQQRYTVATVLQLPRLRSLRLTIEIDGQVQPADTTMLSVGNTQYFGGGMRICPAAAPDDGLLHTVVIGDVPRMRFLRVFPRVFGGRHVDHRDVSVYASARIVVDRADASGAAVDMWADGDLLGSLPVVCEVRPGAVLVAGASV